ncbi:MAG: NUDIX domain-containing protein [Polyangiaceae bacterium]
MLPSPPPHTLLREEAPAPEGPAFLEVRRETYRLRFADGSVSEPFVYDTVARKRLDAVVVAAHFTGPDGRAHVYLRSALRPPVATRPEEAWPVPEQAGLGSLWELPAGLVEEDERSPSGLLGCAARELREELGFAVDPAQLAPLGPSSVPAPGMVGERHFYFHVEVDPAARAVPSEDGSPLERQAEIVSAPLDALLELARAGGLEDAKTELGLRRLKDLLGAGASGGKEPAT